MRIDARRLFLAAVACVVSGLAGLGATAVASPRAEEPGEDLEVETRPVDSEHWLETGLAARRRGDLEAARVALERALEMRRALRDRDGMAEVLGHLGPVLAEIGALDLALEHLRYALSLQDGSLQDGSPHGDDGASSDRATLRNEICLIHQRQGSWDAAEACSLEVLEIARAAGDRSLEARVLNNLGGLASHRGDPRRALDHHREALELRRATGDRFGEAASWNNLGAVHRGLGAFDEAERAYRRALGIFEDLDDRYWQARTLNNLGHLLVVGGSFEAARPVLERALSLRRQAGDRLGEATTLRNLARASAGVGDRDTASSFASAALELSVDLDDRRGRITARKLLGELWLDAERPRAARTELESALAELRAIGRPAEEAEVSTLLARAHRLDGGLDTARTLAAEALEGHVAVGDPLGVVETRVVLARVERDAGRAEAERDHLDGALEVLESLRSEVADPLRRAELLASQHAVYELIVGRHMADHRRDPAAGHDLTALEVSERARSRSLLGLLRQAGVDEARRDALTNTMSVTVGEIQALLDPETLWLEIFLGADASYYWLVDQRSVRSGVLPPRARIDALARRVEQAVGSSTWSRGAAEAALVELGELLLGPLELQRRPEAKEVEATRLVVVADGALQRIPFAALGRPTTDGRHRPLLERFEVVSVPSASVLSTLRAATPAPPWRTVAEPHVTILADPLTAPGRRLAQSRREADSIADMLPSERVRTITGAEARRDVVLAGGLGRPDILHIATHGSIDDRRPERSSLQLADRDASGVPLDGALTLADVAGLDLDSALVVLAGCETALGREIRGEGLIGFSRGFMAAGTPRVIASLWPVRDRATATLMTRVYRGMLEERLPPAAALRRAQLSLRGERRWRHPYFWAAFAFHGDWR